MIDDRNDKTFFYVFKMHIKQFPKPNLKNSTFQIKDLGTMQNKSKKHLRRKFILNHICIFPSSKTMKIITYHRNGRIDNLQPKWHLADKISINKMTKIQKTVALL